MHNTLSHGVKEMILFDNVLDSFVVILLTSMQPNSMLSIADWMNNIDNLTLLGL